MAEQSKARTGCVIIVVAQPSYNSFAHPSRQGSVFTMKFKALGAFAGLALLAACSSPPTATNTSSGAGAATAPGAAPGSEQDLVANVGDRVFYAFNHADLSS